jgi:hypothetical protein
MDEWVLVDTCIWASFFGKPSSPEKVAVDRLLDTDRVALLGPIVAEVLLGFRRKDQADWVASRLQLAHYIEWPGPNGGLRPTLGANSLPRGASSP